MTPGQFGPIRIDFVPFERALDLHHVEDRDALGDADDELELGVDRLQDRVGGEGRRHVDRGGGGAGLRPRLGDGVEDGQADVGLAALAGGDAADHLRAVGDRLLGVEGALAAGQALADDLGVLVDEDGHDILDVHMIALRSASHAGSGADRARPDDKSEPRPGAARVIRPRTRDLSRTACRAAARRPIWRTDSWRTVRPRATGRAAIMPLTEGQRDG